MRFIVCWAWRLWSIVKLHGIGFWALFEQQVWGSATLQTTPHWKNEGNHFVAIVTGGGSGIGLETSKRLVEEGGHVIILDHDESKRAVLSEFQGRGTVEFHCVDLSSLRSVTSFVNVIKQNDTAVHFLINNAGVMLVPLANSTDGFEVHHAVNYLGHAFLALELLDILSDSAEQRGEPSRVIMLSSIVHHCANGNMDYLNPTSPASSCQYSAHDAYAHSKLCCAAFAEALHMHLKSQQKNDLVIPLSVHPGVVNTRLFRHVHPFLKPFQRILVPWFFLHPKEAANGVLAAFTVNPSEGGKYLFAGKPAKSNLLCQDSAFLNQLWETTLQALGR